MPDAIIIQHPTNRKNHCDYPKIPMPTLESEINLLETFSKSKVIAITINHEEMTDIDVEKKILEYELEFNLPVTDVLKYGCSKIITKLIDEFPKLQKRKRVKVSIPQERVVEPFVIQ